MITSKDDIVQLVESILFVAGQGVEINDIAEKLELDKKEVIKAIEQLKEKHKNDGINVITYKQSAQMCSNPLFAEDIATVLNPIREKQLTKAALETAAIIAYKQPVTKLEIEQVRGVNSDYAVQVLSNFNLIEIVGRKDAVGKPLLYGTTDEFLKRFELQSIEDLPDYDELIERIKVIHEQTPNDALYGSTEIIPEEQLADSKAKQELEKTEQVQENNNVIEDKTENETSIILETDKELEENEVKEILNLETENDDIIDNFKDSDIL